MDDLRIGAIGLGLRRTLAETAHRPPGQGSRVTAVADLDEAAARKAADSFDGAAAETDYRQLLKRTDVDAVLVATPDHTHAEIAIDALRAGKAVYLEKPMAVTLAECDAILQAAHETGSPLYVGHNMRHMQFVRLIREIVQRGDIGRPRSVWVRHFVGHGGDFFFKDWHADRSKVGSLLMQKAAHDLDALHWIVGGYAETVQALGDLTIYGKLPRRPTGAPKTDGWLSGANWPPLAQRDLNPTVDVEDLSLVNMRLDNGVLAAYQQCHYTPDYWRNFTVIGDEGRVENFDDGPGGTIRVWNKGRRNYDERGDAEYRIPDSVGGHDGADLKAIGEFVDFVRSGVPTTTSPIAARMAVAAGELATRSLRGGGVPLAVPAPDPMLLDYFDNGQSRAASPAAR
ncbi:Gfo/Idh/MocA family oxidoreductase [Actinoallomurus sp. NPDC050550]|uniref:Gfo/Idh/MocA family protein n=1 Tax=Actinoallomurus sp. NPDC050550 TaxID=3154937 RepID=UPI0033D48C37